jgi:hypothetical protein
MPQILKTLGEMATEKQRYILWVKFFDPRMPIPKQLSGARRALRSSLLQCLDEHSISWSECFEPASMNLLMRSCDLCC